MTEHVRWKSNQISNILLIEDFYKCNCVIRFTYIYGISFDIIIPSVDAGKLCIDNDRESIKLAPTKEVLSFKAYAVRRRMNRLRRSACQLYQSERMVHVISKLEREIELGRIRIRKDRKIHADLGKLPCRM